MQRTDGKNREPEKGRLEGIVNPDFCLLIAEETADS